MNVAKEKSRVPWECVTGGGVGTQGWSGASGLGEHGWALHDPRNISPALPAFRPLSAAMEKES